ncbi:MAG: hypothetical protein MUF66_01020 [Gammaproteobacteria bacterium]|jgi:hypothetical protein|nr:hypothetical protein [Gammaproteobacteria bacterium]
MSTFAAIVIAWVAAIAVVLALLSAAHRLSNADGEGGDVDEEAEAGDTPGLP